jgi:hypothetical protein
MITGQDIHEMYAMTHLHAKQWHEVSPLAKRLYDSLAHAIELEKSSIVAIKCPYCQEMMSAYGYSEHKCELKPNTYYCWTNESEPEHTGGWFCQHPECLNPDN